MKEEHKIITGLKQALEIAKEHNNTSGRQKAMIELLPCPFCDGKAECIMWFCHEDVTFRCRCNICNTVSAYADSEDESIKKWNNRAGYFKQQPSTPSGDEVGQVARAIHKKRQQLGFGGKALWEYEPHIITRIHEETAKAALAAMPDQTALIRQLVEDVESKLRAASWEDKQPGMGTMDVIYVDDAIGELRAAGQAYLQQQEGK